MQDDLSAELERHPFFTPWEDPATGVVSYVLTERAGPVQKPLYHRIPSISADGRWLWFTACFPPSRQWTLSAVRLDADDPDIRLFHRTAGGHGATITPEGDAAWIAVGGGVYRQAFDGDMQEVLRLPDELIANRHLFSLVTELTVSADGRYFVLDPHIGNRWLIALGEIATGEVIPLRWFFSCHHHAQFSPTDPELMMLGRGPWRDPITGDKGEIDVRMWVMDTRLTRYEPVRGDLWFNRNCMSCHEWWSPDGKVAWCDYDEGVYECDLSDRATTLVWDRPLVHAHCDSRTRFYCGDYHPYKWSAERPCGVYLFDRESGRDVAIASGLPEPPIAPGDRRSYHLDPHPCFAADDRSVVYTTTALGNVDVAIAPVAPAAERMG